MNIYEKNRQLFTEEVKKLRKFNQDRLSMLHTPLPANQQVLFAKPKNGPEIDALDYLEQNSPEERTRFLGQAYDLYVKAHQRSLIDFDRMAG